MLWCLVCNKDYIKKKNINSVIVYSSNVWYIYILLDSWHKTNIALPNSWWNKPTTIKPTFHDIYTMIKYIFLQLCKIIFSTYIIHFMYIALDYQSNEHGFNNITNNIYNVSSGICHYLCSGVSSKKYVSFLSLIKYRWSISAV